MRVIILMFMILFIYIQNLLLSHTPIPHYTFH